MARWHLIECMIVKHVGNVNSYNINKVKRQFSTNKIKKTSCSLYIHINHILVKTGLIKKQ